MAIVLLILPVNLGHMSAWGFPEDRKVWSSKESSKDEGGLVRWPSWCRCFPPSLKT